MNMSTTDEQRLREALTELVAHCGEQGWWMESHAIAVMDKAQAAISEPAAPVDALMQMAREELSVMASYANTPDLSVGLRIRAIASAECIAKIDAALARQAAAPAEGKA